jgi:hypothetical protein
LTMFKQRQATTMHMLKHSSDSAVREFYELERQRLAPSQRWSGVLALEQFEAERARDAKPRDQQKQPNPKAERQLLSQWLRSIDDRSRWEHLKELTCQGKALVSLECSSHDPDWMDQILQVPSSLFRFGCEAMLDVLPTNCNLFRWRKRADRNCPLCGKPQTTLHVLNNCQPQLDKYTWRHDSVLLAIADFLATHLAGDGVRLLVDLQGHRFSYSLFPAAIYATTQRPDIVFIGPTGNDGKPRITLVELTMPAEENIEAAARRKKCKYQPLTDGLRSPPLCYSAEFLSIEIGSRGTMTDSLSRTLARLVKRGHLEKFKPADFKQFSMRCSSIALRASYMIWLTRGSAAMPDKQPLLF